MKRNISMLLYINAVMVYNQMELTRGTFGISNLSVNFAQLGSKTGSFGIHCCFCAEALATMASFGLHSPQGKHGGEKQIWSLLMTHVSVSLHWFKDVFTFIFMAQFSGPHGI